MSSKKNAFEHVQNVHVQIQSIPLMHKDQAGFSLYMHKVSSRAQLFKALLA